MQLLFLRMTFDKDKSAGYLINHLARLFAKELQKGIQPLGIVPGQFPVLIELWHKDGITQRELLKVIDVEQATLANTLTRMERDGLIRRTKHPADARAQQIWLTDKARDVREEAYQAANDTNRRALAELPEEEKTRFIALMKKIIRSLRAE